MDTIVMFKDNEHFETLNCLKEDEHLDTLDKDELVRRLDKSFDMKLEKVRFTILFQLKHKSLTDGSSVFPFLELDCVARDSGCFLF
jgi:hypothetical protein